MDPNNLTEGHETVAPDDIPAHVEMLLSFVNSGEGMAELRTAVALSALEHIHPFADGNGRLGRMLACSMLAEVYPAQSSLPSSPSCSACDRRSASACPPLFATGRTSGRLPCSSWTRFARLRMMWQE